MLSKEDTRRLAEIEHRLYHDDPDFCARMAGLSPQAPWVPLRQRVPAPLLLAGSFVVAAAVVMAFAGWWIPAAVAFLWATVIMVAIGYHCSPARPGPRRDPL